MNEIGSEQLQSTAQVAEGLAYESSWERRPRPSRQPAKVPLARNPELADHSEAPLHQVDSLV